MLRLLLVGEQRMFVEALSQYLCTEPDLWVADSADRADAELVERISRARPEVMVIDLAVLGDRVHEALRRLDESCPPVRIVVLASTASPELAVEAARAGTAAWLPKERGVTELVGIIRDVARGNAWYPPEVLGTVLRALRQDIRLADTRNDDPLAALSQREREVLAAMAEGKRGWQIAAELFISVQTVRKHTRGILTKLNVHSQLEAVMLARSAGSLPEPSGATVRALPRKTV
ncbi:two component transcriptional regulator, LuxR family [Actinopolyspora xinjiangensis]|uniref:Two component transcriptional regulator, LuxR family n=1 Tax=Actinopolyspora xinjiangensis TaxID=405564 RepID=A0A1H0WW03_9ACTN|nr:response regulator transcription factor [Actinopolyspora xinjiangensis]SDP94416.1 two component transcriptional regulator, LuxR family [Actinopolyspora xinjiangensis]